MLISAISVVVRRKPFLLPPIAEARALLLRTPIIGVRTGTSYHSTSLKLTLFVTQSVELVTRHT